MSFTVSDLIDRAKVYVDDDHGAQNSWLTPAKWLAIFNAEYALTYKKWVRNGLVQPTMSQSPLTSGSTAITGVLAIVGVARDEGSSLTILSPAQPIVGRDAFFRSAGEATGPSYRWAAFGTSDNVTVELDPDPSDNTGTNYICRYIPVPAAKTAITDTVDLPYGSDERIVLGMARRAHLKDSGASQLLERLIVDADTELGFASMGKVNGPRVRQIGKNPYSTPTPGYWPERHQWRFI